MFKSQQIKNLFPIFTMRCTLLRIEELPVEQRIILRMRGNGRTIDLDLVFPRPIQYVNGHPLFQFRGSTKAVAYQAVPEPEFQDTRSLLDVIVRKPEDVLLDVIRRAIAKSVDAEDPQSTAQKTIDSFFGTDDLIRNVDPHKPLDIEGGVSTIVIQTTRSTKIEHYRYKDWIGIIDYTTTPQGDKIGHSFKLAEGARVEDGRLWPGKLLFSGLMKRCIIFPENTRPNRLLITRPTFSSHEQLIAPEDPLVVHKSYQGELKGVHLTTAIMTHPNNYQDSLVVSESCARKLACKVHKIISHADTGNIEPMVQPGQVVRNNEGVISVTPEDDPDSRFEISNRYARCAAEWAVESVEMHKTVIGGEEAHRCRVDLSTIYMCRTGDKLTTRHGGKGVITIIPDQEMPSINGVPVDILVHPMSFNSRRNLGTFREMMVNRKFWQEYQDSDNETVVKVSHFGDQLTMEELIKEGWGKKTKLDDGFMAFVAPLYWLRTDKHAIEQMSCVTGTEIRVDKDGFRPNSGRLSGKRLSMNYSTILAAQNMDETHKALIQANMSANTLKKVGMVLKALE